jgi:hypothetical protein
MRRRTPEWVLQYILVLLEEFTDAPRSERLQMVAEVRALCEQVKR